MVSLLFRINKDISDDLNCTGSQDTHDGHCMLASSCSDAKYVDLWNYYIKIQFHFAGPYTTVNLASFAADNSNGQCALYV
jgi:hypothetical protein